MVESTRPLGRRGWSRLTHEPWKDDDAADKITPRTHFTSISASSGEFYSQLGLSTADGGGIGIHCLRIEYAKARHLLRFWMLAYWDDHQSSIAYSV